MPIRHYAHPTNNRKNIKIRDIDGLPDDIKLKFQSIDIRYHRHHGQKQFFFCTVHLPYEKDDEGYDLELSVIEDNLGRALSDEMLLRQHEQESTFINFGEYACGGEFDDFKSSDDYHYEAQLNMVAFDELKHHTQVWFDVDKDSGYLLLKIKIAGTSYQGLVFLDDYVV